MEQQIGHGKGIRVALREEGQGLLYGLPANKVGFHYTKENYKL